MLNLGRSGRAFVARLINDLRSGTKLSCGTHDCPQRCHQLFDHSKMECRKIVESICSRNHKLSRPCFKTGFTCGICEAEDRKQELKRERDHKLELEREIKQKKYAQQLTELQDEIAHQRRILRDQSELDEREKIIRQHQQDLNSLRDTVRRTKNISINVPFPTSTMKQDSTTAARTNAVPNSARITEQEAAKDQDKDGLDISSCSAREEWEYQKEFEGAQNEALDSLMNMVGLKDVKEKFLSIKSRIDIAVRQNINMKEERFSAVLLGNPGTGACWLFSVIL